VTGSSAIDSHCAPDAEYEGAVSQLTKPGVGVEKVTVMFSIPQISPDFWNIEFFNSHRPVKRSEPRGERNGDVTPPTA
jgi:hypothetical protein